MEIYCSLNGYYYCCLPSVDKWDSTTIDRVLVEGDRINTAELHCMHVKELKIIINNIVPVILLIVPVTFLFFT